MEELLRINNGVFEMKFYIAIKKPELCTYKNSVELEIITLPEIGQTQ